MPVRNVPRIQKIAPPTVQVPGTTSTGVDARNPVAKPGDVLGNFVAINPVTGEKKWEIPLVDLPGSAGMLATGGGLVFTGKLTGEFVALDESTGKTLWQFQTGSSVNARRLLTLNGKQYVTVASGMENSLTATSGQSTHRRVTTFALLPNVRRMPQVLPLPFSNGDGPFILTVSGLPDSTVKYFSMTAIIIVGTFYFALTMPLTGPPQGVLRALIPYMVIEVSVLGYTWYRTPDHIHAKNTTLGLHCRFTWAFHRRPHVGTPLLVRRDGIDMVRYAGGSAVFLPGYLLFPQ